MIHVSLLLKFEQLCWIFILIHFKYHFWNICCMILSSIHCCVLCCRDLVVWRQRQISALKHQLQLMLIFITRLLALMKTPDLLLTTILNLLPFIQTMLIWMTHRWGFWLLTGYLFYCKLHYLIKSRLFYLYSLTPFWHSSIVCRRLERWWRWLEEISEEVMARLYAR